MARVTTVLCDRAEGGSNKTCGQPATTWTVISQDGSVWEIDLCSKHQATVFGPVFRDGRTAAITRPKRRTIEEAIRPFTE